WAGARARWTARRCKWRWRRCAIEVSVAADVAKRLGITTTTLYHYINGDGTPKAPGQALLDAGPMPKPPTRAREERQAA
ncbi:helix-turn-helix domain-containing protein, partial [Campylobacter coli]|nr:helix-turn-helix domain-containing protein [Campylobacter coli]